MKYIYLLLLINLGLIFSCSSNNQIAKYGHGNVTVFIEQGKAWKHNFPLFWGMINKKNSPQIAIWIEDTCGNYIATIYATQRIATQSWIMSKGNRRKEALPHWCYSRGVRYEDGLYSPTKDKPLPDALTGATPQGSFSVNFSPKMPLEKFVVKIEVNHSTDFNNSYPKLAKKGDSNYSGGEEGSGQPALVYAALINTASRQEMFEAKLIGHSSPDGSSGNVYSDMSGITSAFDIIDRITICVQK